jgi:hypothetical protein
MCWTSTSKPVFIDTSDSFTIHSSGSKLSMLGGVSCHHSMAYPWCVPN